MVTPLSRALTPSSIWMWIEKSPFFIDRHAAALAHPDYSLSRRAARSAFGPIREDLAMIWGPNASPGPEPRHGPADRTWSGSWGSWQSGAATRPDWRADTARKPAARP